MWTKQAVYRLLEESDVPYEKIEHPAVFNMADLNQLHLPHPEADAKTSSCGMIKSAIIISLPSMAKSA